MFWQSKKIEAVEIKCPPDKQTTTVELVKKQEKYIWVKGYKGTDKDMKCTVRIYKPFPGNLGCYSIYDDYIFKTTQYNLKETFVEENEPETCQNGFHFCLNLKDVFNHYQFNFENRFFKVEAYVKESDYIQAVANEHLNKDTKIAAKQIRFIEEVFPDYELLKSEGYLTYRSGGYGEYTISENEFDNLIAYGTQCWRNVFINEMSCYGYTKDFCELYFGKLFEKIYADNICKMKYILRKAKTLFDMKLSKDMSVYLLLQDT